MNNLVLMMSMLGMILVSCATQEGLNLSPNKTSIPSKKNTHNSARVQIVGALSSNARNVVRSAFETDFLVEQDYVNAYDFARYAGNKGMDWWNFPWDLRSSKPEYAISFSDMKTLLENVRVKPQKNSDTYVRYSEKLLSMVEELTPQIMNAHGGYLRVVKIIYCVRNFLAVAQKHNLAADITPLKKAARKVIAIFDAGQLVTGASPYTKGSALNPKNIDGISEDRTAKNGIAELRIMIK